MRVIIGYMKNGNPNQKWFEMEDIIRGLSKKKVWIPLRAVQKIKDGGKYGYAGFKEEFFGSGTVAIPVSQKRQIFSKLGSKLVLMNKELALEIDKRYFAFTKEYRQESKRLEIDPKRYAMLQAHHLEPSSLHWLDSVSGLAPGRGYIDCKDRTK